MTDGNAIMDAYDAISAFERVIRTDELLQSLSANNRTSRDDHAAALMRRSAWAGLCEFLSRDTKQRISIHEIGSYATANYGRGSIKGYLRTCAEEMAAAETAITQGDFHYAQELLRFCGAFLRLADWVAQMNKHRVTRDVFLQIENARVALKMARTKLRTEWNRAAAQAGQ